MIKFFRHIRQKLLAENKFSRYSLYAIGEIVLIVVGILIALQINNWNESRKQEETLDSIYRIIRQDLLTDIDKIESFVNDYEENRRPTFEALLFTQPSKEDWSKNPQYRRVLEGYADIEINRRGYDLFRNHLNAPNTLSQSLPVEITNFYTHHLTEIEVAWRELGEDFSDNGRHLKQYEWLSGYLLNNESDGFMDYVTHDPDARNRITLYWILYSIYVEELEQFKTNAEMLIQTIDKYLDNL